MSTKPIICTVDATLFTLVEGRLHVVLLRREYAPAEGQFALPGAYIDTLSDDDARAAAYRMLREKTGITPPYLEQLETFTGATRDSRGWSISIAYYALVGPETLANAATHKLELRDVDDPRILPFDHSVMVDTAVARLRTKSIYSSLPCYLAGETFTLPHLRKIYQDVIGEPIDRITFKRRMDLMDVLENCGGAKEVGKPNRPGELFRLKPEVAGRLALLSKGML